MRRSISVIAALLIVGSVVGDVRAHTKRPDGEWYFRGATFENSSEGRAGEARARKDPVNVIWYDGGAPGVTHSYPLGLVENQLELYWDARKVGGSPWRKHDDIFRLCKQDQVMIWRHLPGRDADRTDRHGSTARRRFPCGNQHHLRLWDDLEHDRGTPSESHNEHDWAVGGIHYDRIKWSFKGPGHRPGKPWDQARYEMRRALHALCGERAWKYHSGAAGWFQDYYNLGFIARMTSDKQSSGCG